MLLAVALVVAPQPAAGPILVQGTPPPVEAPAPAPDAPVCPATHFACGAVCCPN